MLHSILRDMFHMQLPLLEKILRPIVVYLFLIIFLRIFGKRELAQLNPLDLVVLLSLSNTVQNAMIGDDNSVTGGVIGAFSLMAINWLVIRALFKSPRLNRALQGHETVLIAHGRIDKKALASELITEEELMAAIHKQNFDDVDDVELCVLEPNGSFYITGRSPSATDQQHSELLTRFDLLQAEINELRTRLPGINDSAGLPQPPPSQP
jgi:uncharacterized membrane protein YcaP (DUF421 family)